MPTYSPTLLHVHAYMEKRCDRGARPLVAAVDVHSRKQCKRLLDLEALLGRHPRQKNSPNCVWTQASWLHATVVQNVQSKERRRNMQGNEATWSKYQGWHWRTLWNVGERGCVTACPKVCRGFGVTKSPSRSIRDLIETLGEYEGRASWDGQSSLYNAQPGWPWLTCGRPSIGLSSPDLPIYWPVLPYDLHFVPHTNAPQRDPL